ncbi:Protein of unknown function [Gryllus bimaculatus]|nr:Protein of unknown function [Gryllus bimaculatus]
MRAAGAFQRAGPWRRTRGAERGGARAAPRCLPSPPPAASCSSWWACPATSSPSSRCCARARGRRSDELPLVALTFLGTSTVRRESFIMRGGPDGFGGWCGPTPRSLPPAGTSFNLPTGLPACVLVKCMRVKRKRKERSRATSSGGSEGILPSYDVSNLSMSVTRQGQAPK